MRILKEREVSAAECAYRLCHLPLRGSSRSTVFLNTRKPEQRYYVSKFEGNEAVGMCSNIFERYEKRPLCFFNISHIMMKELLGELSAREAFLACEETLKERSAFMETFRERDRQLEIAFTQAHAFNLLDNPEDVVQAELEEEAVPEQPND
ncbi:hypothetical protein PVAND_014328 [Polypedilum vanderplanki]|uniref:Uncharacterized protein n=1 Tax=Polypedilum vanderplanki TaxID=319348 RepID=A0A9J6CTJ3_POLVA|nr:hypothetical protein PVAND_014328 [Polypedilum vanderplanki]